MRASSTLTPIDREHPTRQPDADFFNGIGRMQAFKPRKRSRT
jgi:hypothetical protein